MANLKKISNEYGIYLISTFAKLALFYFVVRFYPKETFISYNLYLYYTEISVSIVNAGTKMAFRGQSFLKNHLGTAVLFENIFYTVFSGLFLLITHFTGRIVDGRASYLLLFGIGIFRLNIQLFSRYFLVFDTIKRSIFIDIIANFLWIPIVLAVGFIFHPENVQFIFYTWFFFLAVTATYYLFLYRKQLRVEEPIKELRTYLKIYVASFQFMLANQVYGNAEKLVFTRKFIDSSLVASYLVGAKVIGFGAEVTAGFTTAFMENNLRKFDEREAHGTVFSIIFKACLFNIFLFIVIGFGIFVTKPIIMYLLGNQLSEAYFYLLYLALPVCAFNNLYSLVLIFLQRKAILRLPNFIGAMQFVLLGSQIFVKMSAAVFLLSEAGFFAMAFILGLFALRGVYGSHTRVTPKTATV